MELSVPALAVLLDQLNQQMDTCLKLPKISFNKPLKKKNQAGRSRKNGVQVIFKFTVIRGTLVYLVCVGTFPSKNRISFLDLSIMTEILTGLVTCHTKRFPTEYNQSFGAERNE